MESTEEKETKFQRNSRNDNLYSPFAVGHVEKIIPNSKLVKTTNKVDRENGFDYYDENSPNKYDMKHCHGSFMVSLCTNGTINIMNPHRLTSESTHIVQGCYIMKSVVWVMNPIKKIKIFTKTEYNLQYFKTLEDYVELVSILNYYLFKDVEILGGKNLFEFFYNIITPYLKDGVEAFNCEGSLMVADSKLHEVYLKMLNKK